MNKETRNTFIIAGIVIIVAVLYAVGVLDERAPQVVGGILAIFIGIKITQPRNKKEVNPIG